MGTYIRQKKTIILIEELHPARVVASYKIIFFKNTFCTDVIELQRNKFFNLEEKIDILEYEHIYYLIVSNTLFGVRISKNMDYYLNENNK